MREWWLRRALGSCVFSGVLACGNASGDGAAGQGGSGSTGGGGASSSGGADGGSTVVSSTGGTSSAKGGAGGSSAAGGGAVAGGVGEGGAVSTGGAVTMGGSVSTGGANSACPTENHAVSDSSYGPATALAVCAVTVAERSIRYRVTTPAAPAGGGFVVVSFRNVSSRIEVDAQIKLAPGGNALDTQQHASGVGKDFDTWFAAARGADFFIEVQDLFVTPISGGDFVISALFVPVNDSFEPNNVQADAKTITPGTPVQAYAFAGYGAPSAEIQTNWYDWFKVKLPAGKPTVTLSGAPTQFALQVSLDDPEALVGAVVTGTTMSTGSVTISPAEPIVAGDYYITVSPSFSIVEAYGSDAPAAYATQPYTLTVSP